MEKRVPREFFVELAMDDEYKKNNGLEADPSDFPPFFPA